jgi:hypothetical protein
MTPTLGARETGRNVRAFVKANNSMIWGIAKPLIPWLLSFDVLIYYAREFQFQTGQLIISLFSSFFLVIFSISWYRFTINGPNKLVIANPFKPKKSELKVFGLMILILALSFIAGLIAGLILGGLSAFLFDKSVGIGVGIVVAVLFPIYVAYRVWFLLPSIAVNNPLPFKEVLRFTKNTFWKLMGADFFAGWRIFLILFACMMIMAGSSLLLQNNGTLSLVPFVVHLVIVSPIQLYCSVVLNAIGASVLSNYYMWALQNRPQTQAAE